MLLYVFLQVTVHEVIDLVENEDVTAKDNAKDRAKDSAKDRAKDGEKRRRQQLEDKREELLAEMGVNMLSDNSNSCDTLHHQPNQPSRSQQKVSRSRKRVVWVFCGMIGFMAGP